MYIEIVRQVVERAVEGYASSTGQTAADVLTEIRQHIDRTAREYYQDDPNIDYENPLCRLGYLYRHGAANATLFEKALSRSADLQNAIRGADQRDLHICSVGGGPGTELLGLGKHLLQRSVFARLLRRPWHMPRRIIFSVLDKVPQWAETWQQLAEAVEAHLQASLAGERVQAPTIAPHFLPMDVLSPASYQQYAFQFGRMAVVVFNYLFSENKTHLDVARSVVTHLTRACPRGCVFVIIDRLEHSPAFSDGVRELFQESLGTTVTVHTFNGKLDSDEQTSNMGQALIDTLGSPRIKFFTEVHRDPTAFWFTVVRS